MSRSKNESENLITPASSPGVGQAAPDIVVPAGQRWRIQAISFRVSTSPVPNSRGFWIAFHYGNAETITFAATDALQPASKIYWYTAQSGGVSLDASALSNLAPNLGLVVMSLPADFILEAGSKIILSKTSNFDTNPTTGDEISDWKATYELLSRGV